MPLPIVSVIIVLWNNEAYLPLCLSALSKQSYRNFEVVLVDNNSTGKLLENLEELWPNLSLRIQKLNSNRGFAFANNLGVRFSQTKWVALLNVDAFPASDWLEQLVKTANLNPEYTMISSRQIQYASPELLDGAGDAYHISGLAWRNFYNYKASEYGIMEKEVFSPCAAAALYSRDDFIRVGGFDEDYFSYFEDVDLGFRLRLVGARCLYSPQAIVYHVGSASTGKRSDFSVYYGYRNLIWTFFKDMPSPLLWILLPIHFGTMILFLIYLSWRGQGKTILKAIVDAVCGISNILIKRKEIQSNVQINSMELIKVMSTGLLEPYREFIKRNKNR